MYPRGEHAQILATLIVVTIISTGCANRLDEIGVAPKLTPITPSSFALLDNNEKNWHNSLSRNRSSLWTARSNGLFGDQRSVNKGDIFTVNISINDKAQIGNTTDRSQESQIKGALNYATKLFGIDALGAASGDLNSKSSTKGDGAINRSERIQLSVAALVSDVLPNGNLLIKGSQEILVNFELRVLEISGIVRPIDITKDNTISYDKIAEARVSYGGRGRLMEVQQPRLIHQVYDNLRPF